MTGTFAGALGAREIAVPPEALVGQVTGEIEKQDGVLVIRRIHVRYELQIPPDNRDAVARVLAAHAAACPVARSIGGSIEITTEVEYC